MEENIGTIGYRIFELIIVLYVSWIYFQMGRNKKDKYKAMRERFTNYLKWFKSDKHYYAASIIMLLMIVIRGAEGAYKIFGF